MHSIWTFHLNFRSIRAHSPQRWMYEFERVERAMMCKIVSNVVSFCVSCSCRRHTQCALPSHTNCKANIIVFDTCGQLCEKWTFAVFNAFRRIDRIFHSLTSFRYKTYVFGCGCVRLLTTSRYLPCNEKPVLCGDSFMPFEFFFSSLSVFSLLGIDVIHIVCHIHICII